MLTTNRDFPNSQILNLTIPVLIDELKAVFHFMKLYHIVVCPVRVSWRFDVIYMLQLVVVHFSN